MFSSDEVRKRCKTVYDRQVDRHRNRLNKSAKVELDIARDRVLPYSFQEFFDWVWKRYGVQSHDCPWCGGRIDFLSMQFDHIIPISKGGSVTLDNLEGICERCNSLKGEQHPEEFRLLLHFLNSLSGPHRTYLEHRIRAGAVANRMRWFDHKKKEGGKKNPKPLAKQQQLNLGGDKQPIRPF